MLGGCRRHQEHAAGRRIDATLPAGTGFGRLTVYDDSVYYIDGAAVLISGGTASTAVTASGPITAL